jgi:hypothetical protein
MQLKFSPFLECNDPFEFYQSVRVNLIGSQLEQANQYFTEFEEQIKKYKFLCFCKDSTEREGWQLPTMWAHYADNHNGVCLEFESELFDLEERDNHRDIAYEKDIPEFSIMEINPNILMKVQIEDYIKGNLLLFKKFNHWEIENEYRISRNINNDFLKINTALNCVYLGLRASENGKNSTKVKILERLFQDIDREIPVNLMRDADLLYAMKLDDLKFVTCENSRRKS